MKKWMSIFALVCLPWLTSAQDFGVWETLHEAHNNKPNVLTYITRKVQRYRAHHAKLPWADTVAQQIANAQPRGFLGNNTWEHIPSLPNAPVSGNTAKITQSRVQVWNEALKENELLHHFRFSVPNPAAVQALSNEQAQYITQFLQAPVRAYQANPRYAPTAVKTYPRFLVQVTLQASTQSKPIHLIFNTYAKEIYVAYPTLKVPGVELIALSSSHKLH